MRRVLLTSNFKGKELLKKKPVIQILFGGEGEMWFVNYTMVVQNVVNSNYL